MLCIQYNQGMGDIMSDEEKQKRREYTERRISLSLTKSERALIEQARGVSRAATYCHDATMWFVSRCEEFLKNHHQGELEALLELLLLKFRPDRTRHHRIHGGRVIVVFSHDELRRINLVRGAAADAVQEPDESVMDKTTLVYVGVLTRVHYGAHEAQSTPPLERLVALIPEADGAGLGFLALR